MRYTIRGKMMEGKFVRERKESGLEEGKVHTRLTLAKVTDGDGWMDGTRSLYREERARGRLEPHQ